VKQYLVQKGIPANSITTQGYGADKPKGKDKSINRRVDIVVAMR
jgi:outer membrane protein OmpA-like peptidoglycan-associated protein